MNMQNCPTEYLGSEYFLPFAYIFRFLAKSVKMIVIGVVITLMKFENVS